MDQEFIYINEKIINPKEIVLIEKSYPGGKANGNMSNYMLHLSNRETIIIFSGTDDYIFIDNVFNDYKSKTEAKTVLFKAGL